MGSGVCDRVANSASAGLSSSVCCRTRLIRFLNSGDDFQAPIGSIPYQSAKLRIVPAPS
jgi:hypothetical protein